MKVLLFLTSFFVVFFLETFFASLGGLSVFIIFVLFFINKLDWKYIFLFSFLFSMALDVVNHSVLGTTLLISGFSVLFFYFCGLFIPEQKGVLGIVSFLVSFLVFYILSYFLREFILLGSFPSFGVSIFVGILVRSIISSIIVVVFDVMYDKVRGNKIDSKFTFR